MATKKSSGGHPAAKKTRKPKTVKKQKIDTAECERMFIMWSEFNNMRAVARHFKRAPSTIQRIANRDGWKKRQEQIMTERDKSFGRARGIKDHDDLTMVVAVQKTAYDKIVKRLEKKKSDVTIAEFIALTRLAAELRGDIPPESGEDTIADVVAVVQKLNQTETETLDESLATVVAYRKNRPRPPIA